MPVRQVTVAEVQCPCSSATFRRRKPSCLISTLLGIVRITLESRGWGTGDGRERHIALKKPRHYLLNITAPVSPIVPKPTYLPIHTPLTQGAPQKRDWLAKEVKHDAIPQAGSFWETLGDTSFFRGVERRVVDKVFS
jgi:hypothetical protein